MSNPSQEKRMIRPFAQKLLMTVGLAAIAGISFAESNSAPEISPSLPGSQLVAPALLSGPLHTIAEPIKIEGYLGRFIIESRFGKFSVHGANMLAVRVSELQAVEELKKVQSDKAFKDALAESAGKVGTLAKTAVTDPMKTAENLGKGVGTVIGRVGYLASSGAAYVEDKAVDLSSSNAYEKPKTKAAPAGEPEPPTFTGDPLGYNMARRQWAKKINIDPYTSNPVLRPLLDDASAATFAGNFGVSLTLGAVVAPLSYAYAFDDTVRQSVWNHPAIDLEKENQTKLLAIGVNDRTVRELLRNKWFTPTLQTALVARLEVLSKLKGLDGVVAMAAATQGEVRARFLLESLANLAVYHQKKEHLTQIRMSNLVPVGVAADGEIVASIAIDYGTWDKDATAFVQRKELNVPKKTLLVAGKLSPRAQQMIGKAGWTVVSGLRS
jgi:hypothetical protein